MGIFNKNNEYKTTRIRRREKRLLIEKAAKTVKTAWVSAIAITILVIISVSYIRMTGDNFNILNSLKSQYNSKFSVISSESNRRRITYKITDEAGIEFNAYKTKNQHPTERKDDYKEQLIKKFALEYIRENDIEGIIMQENMIANILNPVFDVDVDKYSKVDDTVNALFDLRNYVTQALSTYLKADTTLNLNFGNVYVKGFSVDIPKFVGADTIIKKVKTSYIEYIRKENIIDEDVTQAEINKYLRPTELAIVFDGNMLESGDKNIYATYYERTDEYFINFSDVINYVPVVSDVIRNPEDSTIKFTYNNMEYMIKDAAIFHQNDIYDNATINYFKTFFNAKSVEYDYEEGYLYINFE